jgi:hypothetical protein
MMEKFYDIYVWSMLLLVYSCVVGGVVVQSNETDRVWSEALLHVALTHIALRLIKVMDMTMQ